MIESKKLLVFLFTMFSFGCFSGNVFGNGLNNYTIGAKSQPMASAFAGIADDSSAVLFNPAGLSFNAYKLRKSTELCIGPAYTFATEDDGFQEAKTRHFTISAAARFRF